MKDSTALVIFVFLMPLLAPASAQQPPVVSIVDVVPAKSNTSQADEDGSFPAFIVLRNNTGTPVPLSVDVGGWFLSDDPANPTKWKFPDRTIIAPQGQLIIFASGKDRRPPGNDGRLHTNFTYPCEVPFAGLSDPKPTLVSQFSKRDPQCADECRGVAVFSRSTVARYFVPNDASLEAIWMQPGFADGEWKQGALGIGYDIATEAGGVIYTPLIGTDVVKEMHKVNPSLYIRIPFTVPQPGVVGKLDLAMNYDDGFVCYLNGVEVARRRAPPAVLVPFDSKSIDDRPDPEALNAERISLTSQIGLLVPGENVLAIQGLNSAADAIRFVIRPQLCLELSETQECEKTTAGRDFWLTFPGNAPEDTGNPLHLTVCITGLPGTTGKVEVPGLTFEKLFTIPTNGPVAGTGCTTVEIPPKAALEENQVVEKKGVHITADRNVAVYGTSRIDYSTDTFLALPTECLGRDYLALGYKNVWTNLALLNGSQFGLVAVFDGTQVTIDPSQSAAGGGPFTVLLNKGETFLLRNTADAPSDLSGASIDSSLPVGVFAGHRCANINGKDIFFCNLALEQLLPTSAWASEFVSAPLFSRTHSVAQNKGDTLRLISAGNGTLVTITDDTGVKSATLNVGQVYEQLVIGPAHVIARGQALAALYSNSADFDSVTNSDPFMSLIQPVPSWLSRYLVCAPPTQGGNSDFETSYVNIVAHGTNDAALIQLNGIPVTGFQPVGSSGYFYAQVKLDSSLTQHLIDSPRGVRFAVTVYGFSEFDGYGYPGGFGFKASVPATIVCPADVVIPLGERCEAPVPDLRGQVRVIDPCGEGGSEEFCFDFADLKADTSFKVGQSFTTTGGGATVSVEVAPFFFSDGQSFTNGTATVRNSNQAGGTANEMQVSNVNLVFKPITPWPSLRIRFGEFGGNINLAVNGVRRNEPDFAVLNGASIGGAQITVTSAGSGRGEIVVSGSVSEFAIGGQEFFIDDLCVGGNGSPPVGACFEFDEPKAGSEFGVGDFFTTPNSNNTETISVEVEPFTLSNGQTTTNGFARIGGSTQPGQTGSSVQVNNVLLHFKPASSAQGFSIFFADLGGNVNFSVNGMLRNVEDFVTLNGSIIGGAQVSVLTGNNSISGEIRVTGTVVEFGIGGQELFIDTLCLFRVSSSTGSGRFSLALPGAGFDVSQDPPPGTILSAGEHDVVFTVRRPDGTLIGSCVTRVLMQDGSAVKLECPKEMTVSCQTTNGARVFYEGVRAVSERCGQDVAVLCDPPTGSFLPVGTTVVKCIARNGNAECSFPVHVICDAPRIVAEVIAGGRIRLTWQTGTLEQTDSLTGMWRVVTGVKSGHLIEPTGTSAFFRLRF